MEVQYQVEFWRDQELIPTPSVARAIARAIENVQAARGPHEIRGLKKLAGKYYRIRAGHYRIGISIDLGRVTFMRCLPRRDIYRRFPTG